MGTDVDLDESKLNDNIELIKAITTKDLKSKVVMIKLNSNRKFNDIIEINTKLNKQFDSNYKFQNSIKEIILKSNETNVKLDEQSLSDLSIRNDELEHLVSNVILKSLKLNKFKN